MPWTFEQSTGDLYDPSGNFAAKGYSGAPGFIDNPSDQELKNRGVIPVGSYTIEGPQDFPQSTGPYSLRLNPAGHNTMYGRDGFLIHGDSIEHPGCASEGCIIMPYGTRLLIWGSGDRRLNVVAKFQGAE